MHLIEANVSAVAASFAATQHNFAQGKFVNDHRNHKAITGLMATMGDLISLLSGVAVRLEALEDDGPGGDLPEPVRAAMETDIPTLTPLIGPRDEITFIGNRFTGLSPFERTLIADALDVLQPDDEAADLARAELIDRMRRANEQIGEAGPSFSQRELDFLFAVLSYVGFSDLPYTPECREAIALSDVEHSDLMAKLESPGLPKVPKPIRVMVDLTGGCLQGGAADVPVDLVTVDYDVDGEERMSPRYVPVAQSEGGSAMGYISGCNIAADPAFVDGVWQAEALANRRDEAADAGRCAQCGVPSDAAALKVNDFLCGTCGGEDDEVLPRCRLPRADAYSVTLEWSPFGQGGTINETTYYFDAENSTQAGDMARAQLRDDQGEVRVFNARIFAPATTA